MSRRAVGEPMRGDRGRGESPMVSLLNIGRRVDFMITSVMKLKSHQVKAMSNARHATNPTPAPKLQNLLLMMHGTLL
eukprot:6099908-Amphidinium_carterae.1